MTGEAHRSEAALMVLSAMGPDRPGIVETLSKFVLERDGSIEDSRMAVLGGEFAIIMLLEGTRHALGRIEDEIEDLSRRTGLEVTLKPTIDRTREGEFVLFELAGTGLDHPGIIYSISRVLRQENANIESAHTGARLAAMSGVPVFHFEMRFALPASASVRRLRETLERVAEEQNIDIDLKAVEPG